MRPNIPNHAAACTATAGRVRREGAGQRVRGAHVPSHALGLGERFHGDIEQAQQAPACRRRHLGALARGRLGDAGRAGVHGVRKLWGWGDTHAVAQVVKRLFKPH